MTESAEDHPHVVALPPLIALATYILSWLLTWLVPLPWPFPGSPGWPGAVLVLMAVTLAMNARRQMKSAGTNVNPRQPALAIVTGGPFRFTRNPMYVAMGLLLLGAAIGFHQLWGVLLLVPFYAVIHFGVILREEKYLTGKFGEPYTAYRSRVRRYF